MGNLLMSKGITLNGRRLFFSRKTKGHKHTGKHTHTLEKKKADVDRKTVKEIYRIA